MREAVELTSGDLPFVLDSELRVERSVLTGRQKSAEGVLVPQGTKARTVSTGDVEVKEVASKQRNA